MGSTKKPRNKKSPAQPGSLLDLLDHLAILRVLLAGFLLSTLLSALTGLLRLLAWIFLLTALLAALVRIVLVLLTHL